jgi:mannose-6-phosphate isomerase-like protein (cupin superfamily)
MKLTHVILTLFVLSFPGLARSAGDASLPVGYFPAAQVSALFNKGGVLFDGQGRNYRIQAGHREPGIAKVEIHASDTDIFYILDGSATFVTGGTAVEAANVAPDEIRATSIDGGESRQLAKGDVVVIPNGVPHWFKQVNGTFNYFVVKVR